MCVRVCMCTCVSKFLLSQTHARCLCESCFPPQPSIYHWQSDSDASVDELGHEGAWHFRGARSGGSGRTVAGCTVGSTAGVSVDKVHVAVALSPRARTCTGGNAVAGMLCRPVFTGICSTSNAINAAFSPQASCSSATAALLADARMKAGAGRGPAATSALTAATVKREEVAAIEGEGVLVVKREGRTVANGEGAPVEPAMDAASTSLVPVQYHGTSTRLLSADVQLLRRCIGTSVPFSLAGPGAQAKAATVLCCASAASPAHGVPSFNKLSGVIEWTNAVALYVNIGGDTYDNVFAVPSSFGHPRGAAPHDDCHIRMSWFAQVRSDVPKCLRACVRA
jgi:hypothetical protein